MSNSAESSGNNENENDAIRLAGTSSIRVLNPNSLIGYCHVCDKQVEIERESFTCSECNGGFIELFELNNQQTESSQRTRQSQQTPQQQQQQQTQNPHSNRYRVDAVRIIDANLGNLLPQLLNANLSQLGQSTSVPQSQSQTNDSSRQQPQAQQTVFRQGPARVQLIVPGEPFDLYGVINNVLSDIFDPTRNNPQFSFQRLRTLHLPGDIRDYAWGANGLDEAITRLLNELENSGPPPASSSQLQNLPEVKISTLDVENSLQCAICMEEFKLDELAKKLPCKHLFHDQCIVEWLSLHGTCPVCRKTLSGEDTSQHEYVTSPQVNGSANPSTSNDSNSQSQNTTSNFQSSSSSSYTNTSNTNNNNTNTNSSSSSSQRPTGSSGNNNNNQNIYYDTEFD